MKLRNKVMIPILIVLILSFVGIGVTSILSINRTVDGIIGSQMKSGADMTSQQIALTDEIVSISIDALNKKNLSLAQALAELIAEDESNLETARMEQLAHSFNVDEVHVTDENGVLLWGNVTEFYGFDFRTTEQTKPFLPMLTNPSATLAQEPEPRGTDGVMFQYIGVPRLDKPGIVQVGVSLNSINEIKDSMSVQKAIDGFIVGKSGGVYVLNSDKIVVADSSHKWLGLNGSNYGWAGVMYENKEGSMNCAFEGNSIYTYYRQEGDLMIVTWIPQAELNGYMFSSLITVVAYGLAATLILTVLLIVLFKKFITVPLNEVVVASEQMAQGDMNIRLPMRSNDEVGKLVTSFQNMLDSTQGQITVLEAWAEGDLTEEVTLRSQKDIMGLSMKKISTNMNQMFKGINDSSLQVSTGAKQIADVSQTLAQGATEQTFTVEQLSNSISEIDGKIKNNVQLTGEAAALAHTIKGTAEKGSAQMRRMVQAVKEIGESSNSINKVIKVIDDIAFQTNILALNAAVEAARAGEHGKGFAVVAEEVRNLAAKSAEAAKDTGALISNSIEKAELGVQIADETEASLAEIVSGIGQSNKIISDIAMFSEAQNASITQINDGINQVAQIVRQNSATADESAAASQQMSGQSDILQELILQFKFREH